MCCAVIEKLCSTVPVFLRWSVSWWPPSPLILFGTNLKLVSVSGRPPGGPVPVVAVGTLVVAALLLDFLLLPQAVIANAAVRQPRMIARRTFPLPSSHAPHGTVRRNRASGWLSRSRPL